MIIHQTHKRLIWPTRIFLFFSFINLSLTPHKPLMNLKTFDNPRKESSLV